MNFYEIESDHTLPEDIGEIVSNQFGSYTSEENTFIVDSPEYDCLNTMKLAVYDSKIGLEFSEVPPSEADDDDVISAVQAKNTLLEKITGKTVEDRKEEMRESVLTDAPN